MSWRPYLPRGVAVLLALLVLSLAPTPRADVPLSQNVVPNILTDSSAEFNAVRHDVVLRNATGVPGVWRLKTEILVPIAFTFRTQAGDVVFHWDHTYLHQPTRASQGPELTSTPIILAPGQTLALTAEFAHPPGAMVPIRAVPDAAHVAELARERLVHGLYFGGQALFVAFFLVFAHVLSSGAARSFALYLLGLAVLNAHSHGYTMGLTDALGLPHFPIVRVLQVAVMLAYVLFAMSFLNGQRAYPRFTFWMRVYMVVFAVGLTIEMIWGIGWLSVLAGVTFLAAGIVSVWLALRDRLDGSWYFTAGFVALLIVGVVNFFASATRDPVANDAVDALTLFLQLCDAGIFAGAIVAQTRGLRRARDEAHEAQLAEVRERLALTERLRDAQVETERVRALADRHRSRLATTSHDLRQPLASLRMSLDKARVQAPGLAEDLSTGIDFLDSVLDDTLQDTRPDAEAPAEGREPVPVQVVFDNAARMFGAEAEAKGLDLRVVPSSIAVDMAAIDLIRIVSNLVANAVKYTDTGRILIGVRRGDTAAVEVWDTGPGIPADRLDTILHPYDRAGRDGPDGEGLGLSIAQDLAERHGCTIDVRSVSGKGSCFSLRGLRPV